MDPDDVLICLITIIDYSTLEQFIRVLQDNPDYNINHIYLDNSCLSYAVYKKNRQIIKYLVKHPDIDINQKIHGSSLIFDVNISNKIFKMLLKHKNIDTNIKNDFNYTPLYVHLRNYINTKNNSIAYKKIELLLKHNADIYDENNINMINYIKNRKALYPSMNKLLDSYQNLDIKDPGYD